jgi:hypothetical protein
MNKRSLLRRTLLLFLLGLTVGCAQLPEHAKPRFLLPEKDSHVSRNGFSYRKLDIEDFKAKSLPEDYRQYNHKIGAQSCISIRPSKNSKIRIVQSSYQGMMFYAGSILQLTFEAIFIPDCSWWNPDIANSRERYVLQHEQIHFALAELAARTMNSNAGAELKNYLAIGNTYREVYEDIMEKLKSMGRETMEMNIEEHTDFDEDTSLFYDPDVQRRWLENIKFRLAE